MAKTIRELTADLLAAPSACKEVKEAAQNYLDAAGKEGEAAAAKAYVAELEADIESLMAAKGFSEAVVSIGDDSVDVVVKAEELTDANRAKIDEILTRKTEVSPEGIVITPIHE